MTHMMNVEYRKGECALSATSGQIDNASPALFKNANSPIKTVVQRLRGEVDKHITTHGAPQLGSGQGCARLVFAAAPKPPLR